MTSASFSLKRYPASSDPTLRAWDAADELIIKMIGHFHDKSLWIANDEFGALTCAMAANNRIFHWSDSFIFRLATERNLAANFSVVDDLKVTFIKSTDADIKYSSDQLIIKPTKNLRFFEYQLHQLAYFFPGTPIAIGLMQKHITRRLKEAIERWVIEPTPSRAEKKARVISGHMAAAETPPVDWHFFQHESLTLANMANVFSGQQLDLGARFILPELKRISSDDRICDLGCGNGILSLRLSQLNPSAQVIGIDESYMAVMSARQSASVNQCDNAQFMTSNIFSELERDCRFAHIVCNPPFHQQRLVSTDTATTMIKHSARRLAPSGELWIVANRHLSYDRIIKQHFNGYERVKDGSKFVIFRAYDAK